MRYLIRSSKSKIWLCFNAIFDWLGKVCYLQMEKINKLVIFQLGQQRFALHLYHVETIIHSVEIQPLPMAPDFIAGTINYHGSFLPVIDLRKLFLLPVRELELTDHFIITRKASTRVVIWADSVSEVVEVDNSEIESTGKILMDSEFIEGLFKIQDDIVLIHDLDKLLETDQIVKLRMALELESVKL